jgi:general secretion pathway protein A
MRRSMMSTILSFPPPNKEVVVVTGMMKYAAKLTLDTHCNGGFVAWSGGVGRGKTVCARWMAEELNNQYDPHNSSAFRVRHYEVGKVPPWAGCEEKIAIRSLWHATIGSMDEGVYRKFPVEAQAELLVHSWQRMNLQLVFVDEAGRLSLDAIDGLVLVSDTAGNMKWPLTIVLIGMDDLPVKVGRNERIKRRIHQWCYFQPYKLDETWDLLAALHPYFAALDRKKMADREQVELIHDLTGGIPGYITPFVSRFAGMLRDHPHIDPIINIRAAHYQPSREEERIKQEMGLTPRRKPSSKGSNEKAAKKSDGGAKDEGKE